MRFQWEKFRLLAMIVFISSSALVVGCDREEGEDAEPMPEGELVYEDDFSGDEVGSDWQTGFEGWSVEDGALQVQGAHNDALWLQEPLPESFRVNFRAKSDSEEGDIKFEILGDGETHESGYVGIFGGWSNQLNIIARLDEHGDDRLVGASEMSVEPGRVYEMDVVRTDGRLRWYIDGDLFLTYDDSEPLRGDGHRHFGFNNWEAPLTFEELRIYDLASSD